MRAIAGGALALVLATVATPAAAQTGQTDPEDDPRLSTVAPTSPPTEDDPKLSSLTSAALAKPAHPVPRFMIGFRQLSIAGIAGGRLDLRGGQLDYYPSSKILRFGLSAEGGAGKEGSFDAWYLATGVSLGVQYPWRVTPFIEGRFLAGLLGGSYQSASAVSYIYSGGIEGGALLYLYDRFFVSLSLGWAHPVYSGIDVSWVMEHPGLDPQRKNFATDTFTFKVSLGL